MVTDTAALQMAIYNKMAKTLYIGTQELEVQSLNHLPKASKPKAHNVIT